MTENLPSKPGLSSQHTEGRGLPAARTMCTKAQDFLTRYRDVQQSQGCLKSLGKRGLATFLPRPLGLTLHEASRTLVFIEKFDLF